MPRVAAPAPIFTPIPGDPPVLSTGACAYCGNPREPERSAKYGGNAAEVDPFCSTECAKAHYGVAAQFADRAAYRASVREAVQATRETGQ